MEQSSDELIELHPNKQTDSAAKIIINIISSSNHQKKNIVFPRNGNEKRINKNRNNSIQPDLKKCQK